MALLWDSILTYPRNITLPIVCWRSLPSVSCSQNWIQLDMICFQGKYVGRMIPNPGYFEDKEPFRMAPIVSDYRFSILEFVNRIWNLLNQYIRQLNICRVSIIYFYSYFILTINGTHQSYHGWVAVYAVEVIGRMCYQYFLLYSLECLGPWTLVDDRQTSYLTISLSTNDKTVADQVDRRWLEIEKSRRAFSFRASHVVEVL